MSAEGHAEVRAWAKSFCAQSGWPLGRVLSELGVSRASYYRRESAEHCARSTPRRVEATPAERATVLRYASEHPYIGYKRLCYLMLDEKACALPLEKVRRIMGEEGLLGRRQGAPEPMRRPEPPSKPDQVWYVDLMYVRIAGAWFYRVDVLDGYSRFVVDWSLNRTATADTVTFTIQRGYEKWQPELQPIIIHDGGPQFVSKEWRRFLSLANFNSVKTKAYHPQSNGRLERHHRSLREEAFVAGEFDSYERAERQLEAWTQVYNHQRPHLALKGLTPYDHYRGDPDAKLAARKAFLQTAARERKHYWMGNRQNENTNTGN